MAMLVYGAIAFQEQEAGWLHLFEMTLISNDAQISKIENHMIEGVWLELFVNTQSQSSSVLHTDPQTHQSI